MSASRIPGPHRLQCVCHHGSSDGIREYMNCSWEAGKHWRNPRHYCLGYGNAWRTGME